MIIWLIIAATCVIIGTIGVVILHKNKDNYLYLESKWTISLLMAIFG